MKTMLKRSISGTRLEPLLRRVHGYVGSQPIVAHLQARLGDKSRLYDLQTLQVMRKLLQPASCCIDVGCHRGVIMKEMVALAPQGDHWGFAERRRGLGHVPARRRPAGLQRLSQAAV